MPSATPQRTDGRVQRRLAAMRRVQAVALALFEAQGLSAVSVEDVAARAQVGPASIYRNFGSKEGLVLWDDYDPGLLAGIARRLPRQAPLLAVRDTVLDALALIYARDRQRILRRSRLLLAEPTLIAANAAKQESFRAALVTLFLRRQRPLQAHVLAGVALGLLEACVREWTRRDGRVSMTRLVKEAFASVTVAADREPMRRAPK